MGSFLQIDGTGPFTELLLRLLGLELSKKEREVYCGNSQPQKIV